MTARHSRGPGRCTPGETELDSRSSRHPRRPAVKLYYHPASTTSRIVRMFAADQGIDLDCVAV